MSSDILVGIVMLVIVGALIFIGLPNKAGVPSLRSPLTSLASPASTKGRVQRRMGYRCIGHAYPSTMLA